MTQQELATKVKEEINHLSNLRVTPEGVSRFTPPAPYQSAADPRTLQDIAEDLEWLGEQVECLLDPMLTRVEVVQGVKCLHDDMTEVRNKYTSIPGDKVFDCPLPGPAAIHTTEPVAMGVLDCRCGGKVQVSFWADGLRVIHVGETPCFLRSSLQSYTLSKTPPPQKAQTRGKYKRKASRKRPVKTI